MSDRSGQEVFKLSRAVSGRVTLARFDPTRLDARFDPTREQPWEILDHDRVIPDTMLSILPGARYVVVGMVSNTVCSSAVRTIVLIV